jgi:hypothetical protein
MTYTPKVPDPSNSIEKIGKHHKLKEMKKALKKRGHMENHNIPENQMALTRNMKMVKRKIRYAK